MTAFYNEPDPYAATWLENLIAAGHIAPGVVDRRPIQEIEAFELAGFTQCHFFAGIGIWSHALRRAGWSDDRPIWTGSCPCQPFSAAGQRKGTSDERHLWPTWFKLVEQCHPAIVVGEQVASKDGLGWLDLVSTDLEGAGYAFGASDLCAAGFQQAHIRQRLYFVGLADDAGERWNWRGDTAGPGRGNGPKIGSSVERLADPMCGRQSGSREIQRSGDTTTHKNWQKHRTINASGKHDMVGGLGNPIIGAGEWNSGEIPSTQAGQHGERRAVDGGVCERSSNAGGIDGVEHTDKSGQYGRASSGKQPLRNVSDRTDQKSDSGDSRQIASRWLDVDWLLCRNPVGEPSWRAVEPGTFPLAHGITNRMGKLRAFGNGLDAETATNFCEVVREIVDDLRPLEREYDL